MAQKSPNRRLIIVLSLAANLAVLGLLFLAGWLALTQLAQSGLPAAAIPTVTAVFFAVAMITTALVYRLVMRRMQAPKKTAPPPVPADKTGDPPEQP